MPVAQRMPDYRRICLILAAGSLPRAARAQQKSFEEFPATSGHGGTDQNYWEAAAALVRRTGGGRGGRVRWEVQAHKDHIFRDPDREPQFPLRWTRTGLPDAAAVWEWMKQHLIGNLAPLYAFHAAVWYRDWLYRDPQATVGEDNRFQIPPLQVEVRTVLVFPDHRESPSGWGLLGLSSSWGGVPQRLRRSTQRLSDLAPVAPTTNFQIRIHALHRRAHGNVPADNRACLLRREAQLPLRMAAATRRQLDGLRQFELDLLVELLQHHGPLISVYRAAGHLDRLAPTQVLQHPTGYEAVLEIGPQYMDLIGFRAPAHTFVLAAPGA